MAAKFKRRLWLALGAFVAGVATLVLFRSLLAGALVAVLASLSASAVAGSVGGAASGKAGAAAGLHAPALVGALFGAALQWRQTKGRPRGERWLLAGVSLVAAYFGGLLTGSAWPELGDGAVGLGALIAANLAVSLIGALQQLLAGVRDALLALLHDVPWLKRLIASRLGGDAAAQSSSTESVDNPVPTASQSE